MSRLLEPRIQMFLLRYAIGVSLAIGAICFALASIGDIDGLWVPASYAVVLGGCAGLLIATFPSSVLRDAMRVSVMKLDDRKPEELQVAASVLAAAMRYLAGLGAIAFLLGMLSMLRRLNSPAQIGMGMATALVGAFCALFFGEVLILPLWYRVSHKVTEPERARACTPPFPAALLLVALGGTLFLFVLLFTLFSALPPKR